MNAMTERSATAQAYERMSARLLLGSDAEVERKVGYKGASERATLRWHADLKMWVLLQPERINNRYWCAFGVDDPRPASMLSITCEINPPKEGIDRRCAGLFVEDVRRDVYLAHSGKVGGGRPGISKSAFLDHYGREKAVGVRFPDRKEYDYIIIGRVDDPELRRAVADFVHAVDEFKSGVV